MNNSAKVLFFTVTVLFITSLHAEDSIKPAGNMLVCAIQRNQSAFATDYFGNLVFCTQGVCRKIMNRPGNALPQQLECISNSNVAYVVYSNNKLYRCTSDSYLLNKKGKSGCIIQVMD